MLNRLNLLFIFVALLSSGIAYSETSIDLGLSETEELGTLPTSKTTTPNTPSTQSASASPSSDLPIQEESALQAAGQVVWVKGVITATYPEQAPRSLARGAAIYEKDTLTTDINSTGEITFTDNSLLSLRPNTTLVIEQYHFSQKKVQTSGQYILNLIKGGFRTITGFVAKSNPENYQVKTPVATIGVRGTTYNANCINGTCAVGLEKGKGVTVLNDGGIVELTPDKRYAVISSSSVKPVLSESEPAILSKPPIMLSPMAPPPPGANPTPQSGSGNCGILIQ